MTFGENNTNKDLQFLNRLYGWYIENRPSNYESKIANMLYDELRKCGISDDDICDKFIYICLRSELLGFSNGINFYRSLISGLDSVTSVY